MSAMAASLVIFTDLDGTLLDHETYSFAPARPALRRLEELGVPLVLCSSKTRAEIEQWRYRLENRDPFVVENGGAIFVPKGYFRFSIEDCREIGDYEVVEMGTAYEELRRALLQLRQENDLPLVGFGDLTVEEVMTRTGLSREEAELAKKREYDEPFFCRRTLSEQEEEQLETAVHARGLRLTRGGRFYHLMGANDKGLAVRRLIQMYTRVFGGPPRSVALGDSANDLPMLASVEVAILVQKPGGEYDPQVLRQIDPRRAPGPDPVGWNAAVLALLQEGTSE
jgi:mannosyl-3-phosphoglycerate phosphatase